MLLTSDISELKSTVTDYSTDHWCGDMNAHKYERGAQTEAENSATGTTRRDLRQRSASLPNASVRRGICSVSRWHTNHARNIKVGCSCFYSGYCFMGELSCKVSAFHRVNFIISGKLVDALQCVSKLNQGFLADEMWPHHILNSACPLASFSPGWLVSGSRLGSKLFCISGPR